MYLIIEHYSWDLQDFCIRKLVPLFCRIQVRHVVIYQRMNDNNLFTFTRGFCLKVEFLKVKSRNNIAVIIIFFFVCIQFNEVTLRFLFIWCYLHFLAFCMNQCSVISIDTVIISLESWPANRYGYQYPNYSGTTLRWRYYCTLYNWIFNKRF